MIQLSLISVLLVSLSLCHVNGSMELDHLKYFETLHHKAINHQVRKRSISGLEEKVVTFKTHGRSFTLHLTQDSSIVADDLQVTIVNDNNQSSSILYKPDIYRGYAGDTPVGSTVSAYYDNDGTLTAHIQQDNDTFVIEPSWRHLPVSESYTQITYRASDLQLPQELKRMTCGHSIQPNQFRSRAAATEENREADQSEISRGRKKRSVCGVHPDRKICSLLLVADHKFHRQMGFSDKAKTANYLVGLVDRIDGLFKSQEFGDCGSGFGFQIKKIMIWESPTLNAPRHYNSANITWNVSTLLKSFGSPRDSNANYKDVCLAHLFTAVSFDSGVLGYSNLAEASDRSSGGICSNKGLHYDEYANIGWTTVLNSKGQRVVSLQATLVTAHEFGHNWGSAHDDDVLNELSCYPPPELGGKYLMHMYSVSGLEHNNKNFSPCSRRTIGAVLNAKAYMCFTEKSNSFCGNYKVEDGEECDEGPEGENLKVRCCHNCRFRRGANCSDTNSQCCKDCNFAPASTQCHIVDDGECTMSMNCSGDNATCPEPSFKENGTPCRDSLQRSRCRDGKCLFPCEYINKTSCICAGEDSCRWCCQDHSNATCQPHVFNDASADSDYLPDEWPCDSGTCHKGECIQRAPNAFNRIWDVIRFESVSQRVRFMHNNIVGTVIILSLVVWIPASCFISYIDRRREREAEEEEKWYQKDNTSLIGDHSNVRILKSSQPRERKKLTLSMPR